jgi:hypothetical protein
MKSNERRMSPRKTFVAPIRFRLLAEEIASSIGIASAGSKSALETRASLASLEQYAAETVNISERGLCFLSAEKLAIGEPLEMTFTLPRDLTGRNTEEVCCNARVVHVDPERSNGAWRIGAYVESYRPVRFFRNWDN